MDSLLLIFASLIIFWILAFKRAPLYLWSITIVFLLSILSLQWMLLGKLSSHTFSINTFSINTFSNSITLTVLSVFILSVLWILVIFLLLFNIPKIRLWLFSERIFNQLKKHAHTLSRTEQEAIDAGEVWWESDLFQGKPNWQKIITLPKPSLTEEELSFLDNQVERLCEMLNDWTITHETLDLPQNAWQYLKDERFFGMIIPKEYGGLGFSALAGSTIVQKIATRSLSAAVTTMVPNSLGPAELLLHYGTEEQKHQYLTKLARGLEIPCFALTSREAGSDATAIPDTGIVTRGIFEGKEIIGMRLNWDKRYITLAPLATVLGLVFKLYDPEKLIGEKEDLGLTLCLIPTTLEGIEIGSRHFPLNQSFMNGPTRGKDVFVPLSTIIGGEKKAGKGWRMLVESLAAGRGISLPALSTAAAKLCYRTTGAYARVRQQFHASIGKFEGVQEAMARMAGFTYILEATRLFTLSAIDQHIRPSIASAIAKYHMTELSRCIANDAMDVQGGRGIMLGPKNYLGRCYQSMPISITVEGANILTRSLIIFGQGLIRCHPYLRDEMKALQNKDQKQGLHQFDRTFCQHLSYTLGNFATLILHNVTGSFFTPKLRARSKQLRLKVLQKHIRQLGRMSTALSFVSDITLFFMGEKLKRKERLSARLGDVLSNLYLASAVIKYYYDFGHDKYDEYDKQNKRNIQDKYVKQDKQDKKEEDAYHSLWAIEFCLFRIQEALIKFFRNFNNKMVGCFLRFMVFPWGLPYKEPLDKLDHTLADMMMMDGSFRDRLSAYCYLGDLKDSNIAVLDNALRLMMEALPLLQKLEPLKKRNKEKPEKSMEEFILFALNETLITEEEANLLRKYEAARIVAIQVDEFKNGI